MKTIEHSPARLVLEHRPVALAVGLIVTTLVTLAYAVVLFARGNDAGVIFLCFALSPPVFAYFFLETRRITLDRAAGHLELEYRAPRGKRASVHPFSAGAKVVVMRPGPASQERIVPDAGAPGVPTRAVLVGTDGSETALAEGYSKGPEAYRVMQAVNTWLAEG